MHLSAQLKLYKICDFKTLRNFSQIYLSQMSEELSEFGLAANEDIEDVATLDAYWGQYQGRMSIDIERGGRVLTANVRQ